jgi:hypothetical protein
MKTVLVIAPKGRRTPIHPSVASGVGGRLLIVGEDPVELPLCGYVKRRMRAGDLELAIRPSPVVPKAVPSPIDPPKTEPRIAEPKEP